MCTSDLQPCAETPITGPPGTEPPHDWELFLAESNSGSGWRSWRCRVCRAVSYAMPYTFAQASEEVGENQPGAPVSAPAGEPCRDTPVMREPRAGEVQHDWDSGTVDGAGWRNWQCRACSTTSSRLPYGAAEPGARGEEKSPERGSPE